MVHHWQSQHVQIISGVDDMVLLPKITEDAIMENLRKRYMDDYIYTCIGPVLVSINPFKQMPYFGEREVQIYQGAAPYENPPHIYGLADEMYRNMLIDVESQCVIISGESGAGKTIAAKYIMAYISRVSGGGERVQRVKDIILESNPLLEAFGNAKTLRNNNSSRFGKYVEMQFGDGGQPIGGKISNFLLEKSRVVRHNSGERNFHIFYQLTAGANEQMKSEFGLRHELNNCDYLMSWDGNRLKIGDRGSGNDAKDFQETLKALSVMDIKEADVFDILKLVAGILHIGNIKFQENGNYSQIIDNKALQLPAYLLGIPAERLSHKLTSRGFESKWGSQSESVDVTLNVAQSLYTRDALAKDIYARLFDYLVKRVNSAMENSYDSLEIAILDIYGFEIFENNGFEQFCINFVNEKLQQIFIELTLKAEQEEYIAENIRWTPIDYFNNAVVVDLLEGRRPPGIFLVLDDVCATLHGGSNAADSDLQKKLSGIASGHAHFHSTSNGFAILHYAGQVVYSTDGFCDKNRDVLFPDLIELMRSSTNRLVQTLYPQEEMTNNTKTLKMRPTTAGSKIRSQASRLVSQLTKCTPHYIRCIKPNETKKPKDWDSLRVKHQVEYLGLKENIRVRRAGFAYRRPFAKFLHRYAILTKETWPYWNGDEKHGVQWIMSSIHIEESQYQLGKTKVFIKAPESLFMLEEARDRKYNFYARIIQKSFKKYFARKRQDAEKQAATDLLFGHKQRRRASLERNFVGDYIGIDGRPGISRLLGRREKVVFAEIVKKYDRRFKMCRRDLIVTDHCLYLIGRTEKSKKESSKKTQRTVEEVIKRKITFEQISHVSVSTLQDDFVIIHAKEDYASLLQIMFKTEFLSVLNKKYLQHLGHPLNIKFSNSLEFKVKKEGWGGGGTRQVKFSLTGYGDKEFLRPQGKVLNVIIGPGMPSTSRPSHSSKSRVNLANNYYQPIGGYYNVNNNTEVLEKHNLHKSEQGVLDKKVTPVFHQESGTISKAASLSRNTVTSRPQLPPNRPNVCPTYKIQTNANKTVPALTATLGKILNNPSGGPRSGFIRPPPPPSDPAPPNQPVVHAGFTAINNQRLTAQDNKINDRLSDGQRINQINDPNQRLAETLRMHSDNKNKQKLPPRPPPVSQYPRVKALYDYEPQDLDELGLKEGAVIEVIKEHEGGWWFGRWKGKTGLFPSNYVEKI
ncbi:unconventional myosin-Ie-like [Chelonus insularis]|uniref:unconventional myosin-Ie-like n=1 Tax=Chelonus insularis TaxID=460826 RepID=UPI00158F1E58|nr:unconventional myosin-Ie-like [Chelonus insularis]